jgi:hypothetical protein
MLKAVEEGELNEEDLTGCATSQIVSFFSREARVHSGERAGKVPALVGSSNKKARAPLVPPGSNGPAGTKGQDGARVRLTEHVRCFLAEFIDEEERRRDGMQGKWKRSRVVMADPVAAMKAARAAASNEQQRLTPEEVAPLTVQRIRTWFANERSKRKRERAAGQQNEPQSSGDAPTPAKRGKMQPRSAATPHFSSGKKKRGRGRPRRA